ncbi:uncharacterized protein BDR25DRAFT_357158 [Lindgomyces ingoldianus]|uniref:Uncharacterized protein n=1 Tax=Lindgomyces ingoldianus TaxID=673940 RepID=A0ACB6QPJ0_9PLEO|nr:uncharacterized protein BDR25DRAFT_357158 [Lindgomyces ingoldianus]KAF2468795.1 hypothetical protein BDR25DRAFT_357158 [Lindgomyces ingoldianus]
MLLCQTYENALESYHFIIMGVGCLKTRAKEREGMTIPATCLRAKLQNQNRHRKDKALVYTAIWSEGLSLSKMPQIRGVDDLRPNCLDRQIVTALVHHTPIVFTSVDGIVPFLKEIPDGRDTWLARLPTYSVEWHCKKIIVIVSKPPLWVLSLLRRYATLISHFSTLSAFRNYLATITLQSRIRKRTYFELLTCQLRQLFPKFVSNLQDQAPLECEMGRAAVFEYIEGNIWRRSAYACCKFKAKAILSRRHLEELHRSTARILLQNGLDWGKG